MPEIALRPLLVSDAPACDAIIAGLPEFFGHEGGRAQCAAAVRAEPGWVAVARDEVLGFVTWSERTAACAEATWMAVRRDRRNQGIGTALVEQLAADLTGHGFTLALVMTSAASKDPRPEFDEYEATRQFWMRRGFLPLIELNIWETDFALLLVRPLVGGAVPV